jgi:xanthine dehydrogenase small subunit
MDEAIAIIKTEISPISDTRGSKEYKTLLLTQLVKAHFLTLLHD